MKGIDHWIVTGMCAEGHKPHESLLGPAETIHVMRVWVGFKAGDVIWIKNRRDKVFARAYVLSTDPDAGTICAQEVRG